jgi:uncharacterized membrane protein (UPF0127 family)
MPYAPAPVSRARRPRRPPCAPRRAALAAVLIASVAAAAAQPAGERVAPQPRLPTVEIQAGMHLIRAELAADGNTRMRGLMMRERLGPNEGMLFVFQEKAGHCFWMKNTLIPLSIAFVEDDGSIVNIADMKPHAEDSHCPAKPIRFALEMEQGWFARRGLQAGSRLVSEKLFRPSATRN